MEQEKELLHKQIEELVDKINTADAILVGTGSGMSAAAGHRHYYTNDHEFEEKLGKFGRKYGFKTSFDGFYFPYASSNQRWPFIAALGNMILDAQPGQPYEDLKLLIDKKPYMIMTTNQDNLLAKVFPEDRIAAIQGNWKYLQCSRGCHDELYDAKPVYENIISHTDENLEVPDEYIPHCQVCGGELMPWVRHPGFLEKSKYHDEYRKINEFLEKWKNQKILFLELGVGRMTPMFIQEPFWNLTYNLKDAFYITINPKDAIVPAAIKNKGLAIHEDIALALGQAVAVDPEIDRPDLQEKK